MPCSNLTTAVVPQRGSYFRSARSRWRAARMILLSYTNMFELKRNVYTLKHLLSKSVKHFCKRASKS